MRVIVSDCPEAGLSGIAADLRLVKAPPQPDLLCLPRRQVTALRDDLTWWLEQTTGIDDKY